MLLCISNHTIAGGASADQVAAHAERVQKRADQLSEGLRYLCAAIENRDMRAGVAANAGGEGPAGFTYLEQV